MFSAGRQAHEAVASPESFPVVRSSTPARSPLTLFDLIEAVSESAETEAEVVATVRHMLGSGQVRILESPTRRAPRRKLSRV